MGQLKKKQKVFNASQAIMAKQRSPACLRSHTFIFSLNICLRLVWSTCQHQWSITCLNLLSQTSVLAWSEALCTLITPFIFSNVRRKKPQQGCLPNLTVINLSMGEPAWFEKARSDGLLLFFCKGLIFPTRHLYTWVVPFTKYFNYIPVTVKQPSRSSYEWNHW